MVRLVERVTRGLSDDADLRREAEKIESILTGEIGDGYELPFLPKQAVWKARDVALLIRSGATMSSEPDRR